MDVLHYIQQYDNSVIKFWWDEGMRLILYGSWKWIILCEWGFLEIYENRHFIRKKYIINKFVQVIIAIVLNVYVLTVSIAAMNHAQNVIIFICCLRNWILVSFGQSLKVWNKLSEELLHFSRLIKGLEINEHYHCLRTPWLAIFEYEIYGPWFLYSDR